MSLATMRLPPGQEVPDETGEEHQHQDNGQPIVFPQSDHEVAPPRRDSGVLILRWPWAVPPGECRRRIASRQDVEC